jgi:hypothetical protein
VTSSDGDASGRGDPRSDTPAAHGRRDAGTPPGHDPADLPPPADPWLAEAHTSALDDASSLRDPGAPTGAEPAADTAPYTDTAPYIGLPDSGSAADAGPPYPSAAPPAGPPHAGAAPHAGPPYTEPPYTGPPYTGPPYTGPPYTGPPYTGPPYTGPPYAGPPYTAPLGVPDDSPPRRRRAKTWLVAVLTAGVLLVAAMPAIDRFGSDGDGDGDALAPDPRTATSATSTATSATSATPTATPTAVRPPARSAGPAAPGTSASAAAPKVVYEVTASGSRNTGSVTYTDQDGDFIRLHGIALPWRKTIPVGVQRKPLVLLAQRKGGGDAGPVTCTITVNGKLLSSTTAHGKYASAQCSGSG